MSPPDSPSAQEEVDRLALSLEATSLLKQPDPSLPEQTFDDLPDDVASIIFQFHSIELAGKPRLLNLGAVCRRWRDIAWAAPSLWTSLNATFWGYKEQPSDIQLELIRTWLNRSGNLPLSISLTVYGGNKEGVFGRLREMVEILNYHCDHWYSLDLDVPSDLITYVGTSKCTLSKLNELSLKSEGGVGRLPNMSQCSPCIVKIESVQWRVQDLDWTRVTNLVMKLGFIAVHQALGILRAAPSLLNCSLASIGHHEDGVSSAEAYRHVTHPTLRALAVNISGRYSHQADQLFFTNISLPALERFSVFGSGDKIDAGSLVTFLRQSACQLKSLSLDGSDIPGTGLIQLVRTVPSLEALYITSHYPEYGNLDHFYYAFSQHLPTDARPEPVLDEPLLPSLRIFKWFGHDSTFSFDLLPKLFSPLSKDDPSRRRPLKVLRIRQPTFRRVPLESYYLSENLISELSDLLEGVEFNFITDNGDNLWKLSLQALKSRKARSNAK